MVNDPVAVCAHTYEIRQFRLADILIRSQRQYVMRFYARFTDPDAINGFRVKLTFLAKKSAVFAFECPFFCTAKSRTSLTAEMWHKLLVPLNPKSFLRVGRHLIALDFLAFRYNEVSGIVDCVEAWGVEATPEVPWADFKAKCLGCCQAKDCFGGKTRSVIRNHVVIRGFAKRVAGFSGNKFVLRLARRGLQLLG